MTHRVHLHARAKVGQLEVSISVQQHVVGLHVPMDEAHGVNGIQGHHHLRCVEFGPLFRHVIGAGEVDQVTSRHVLHYHVEVVLILEGTAQLNNTNEISLLEITIVIQSIHKEMLQPYAFLIINN